MMITAVSDRCYFSL